MTQSFFHKYLRGTRGVSAHTLRAYLDALKLFFLFLADWKHKAVADLSLEDFQAETLVAFLNHIEAKRRNSYARLLRPKLAQIMPGAPALQSKLRTAFDHLESEIQACCQRERLAA